MRTLYHRTIAGSKASFHVLKNLRKLLFSKDPNRLSLSAELDIAFSRMYYNHLSKYSEALPCSCRGIGNTIFFYNIDCKKHSPLFNRFKDV